MKIIEVIEFIQKKLKVFILISYVVLSLLVVMDAFPSLVNKEHAHTAVEHLPGFWAGFGLIGYILLLFISKWYGHAGIMQREDYYNE
jgi:hypothetical protein